MSAAADPSESTQPSVSRVVPLPWKIEPEQDDEDEREGERPEHRRAIADVAPDVRAV